jgi:uncharacterized protein YceH (UPF0502 family)
MAELMLRGRQTAGELRTHAVRMVPFEGIEGVTAMLESLMAHDPPYVEELPREPGRSANRFRHLLSPAEIEGTAEDISPPGKTRCEEPAEAADVRSQLNTLAARVSALEARVAELANRVGRLPTNGGA